MTTREDKKALVADLLRRMAVAAERGDTNSVTKCITEAWNANVLQMLASAPGCRECFESLTQCPEGIDEADAVLILADLGRLPAAVWSRGGWGAELANRLLAARVPKSFLYGDGKQRRRAASVVRASGARIDGSVMAHAAAAERHGEEARREWISALLNSERLSRVFELLGDALPYSNTVADARSDRIQRLLKAVEAELPDSDFDIDDEISEGLRHFIRQAHSQSKQARYGPAAAAAEALFRVATHLLRFKFRLGAEATFFLTISEVSRWLPDGGWQRLKGSSAVLKQLRGVLIEGLLLLLEQGRPDQDLLRAHASLCPNSVAAREELRVAENSARNVSSELRKWLVSGGGRVTKSSTSELDESDDLSIAMALIAADQLRKRALTDSNIVNDLRFRAPVHVDAIVALFSNARDLTDRVIALAGRRQLRLFGSPGEVVEFSPHAYRLPDDSPLTRRVQIVSPGVEKSGRVASKVVVPALVAAVA